MAKEDVQVIYEEADDEYWMKPLREAIVNVGNSWAGAIVRKQHYANEYANNAANRAHEAFLAQMNNKSTERVAGMRLGADIARYKALDKQHKETMDLKRHVAKREDMIFAQDQTERKNEVLATEAVNKLYTDFEEFKIDPKTGNIGLKSLDKDKVAALNKQMALSPAINTKFKDLLMKRKARRETIAGRMQMLKTLQKKYGNESVISHILHRTAPGATDIAGIDLSGPEGTDGHNNLQALGRAVSDDQTWADVLDSYGLDSVTAPKLKEFEFKGGIEHGQMINHTGLDKNRYKFDPTDYAQMARTKDYHRGMKTFAKPFSPTDKDNTALMAAVNNLGEGFQGLAKNMTDMMSASAIRFSQEEGVYFTAPEVLINRMKTRITKVAQKGPDATFADGYVKITDKKGKEKDVFVKSDLPDAIDQAIHDLMFGEGDLVAKKNLANNIMRRFIKAEKFHKNNGIQSVVDNKVREKDIANMFEGDDFLDIADDQTSDDTDGTPDLTSSNVNLGYGQVGASTPNTTSISDFLQMPGFENEKLLNYMTKQDMFGINNGVIDGSNMRMDKIPVKDWMQIVFSGRTDTVESKFFTDKLHDMQAKVAQYSDSGDLDEDYYKFEMGMEPDYLAGGPKGIKLVKGKETFKNLKNWYDSGQKVAEQILLQYPPGLIFQENGTPQAWMRGTLAMGKGDRIQWSTLKENFKNAPNPELAEKMWDAIFTSMGIGKDVIDDGTYFGVGHRIRRLAESALPENDPTKSMFRNSSSRTFNVGNKQF